MWLENQKLSIEIQAIFEMSYHSWGALRIKEELRTLGYKVSKPRVVRIIKSNHLYAVRTCKFKATTASKHKCSILSNLRNQNSKVQLKHQVWVSDIIYIHTK